MEIANKKNIAIIGLGEIGSRHLQALADISIPSSLYAVDPSKQSISMAKSRLKKNSSNQEVDINFLNSVADLPKQLELAIIATTSEVRLKVLESLFTNTVNIENIIFEKVVFQSSEDFARAKFLLGKNQVDSWVNCPRRAWPIYNELRSFLRDKENLSIFLKGGDWGMACNSIHFIDLIEWITSSEISRIDIDELDPEILDSKRKGFIELSGKLKVEFTGKNELHLSSDINSTNVPELEIYGDGFKIFINESSGKLFSEKGIKSNFIEFKIPYQSELSNKIAEDILLKKTSKLPCFEDSMRQHIVMLDALQKHLENISLTKIDYCPIT